MADLLYRTLGGYLKDTHHAKIKKICIDGGFTCPNRDGTCGTGGCIYCGERGAGEHMIRRRSIREQVEKALAYARRSEKYIAYFQNFTNTYADVSTLKERYDAALIDDRIVGLSIGTRPDCIDEPIAALLETYRDRYDVWVELGLQTANDETAVRIRRGYPRACFERAMQILARHRLSTVVHLMIGLPGEDAEQVRRTATYLSRFPIFGVKLHAVYVMEGTDLATEYREGRYTPIECDAYADSVIDVLSRLSPSTVVHRLVSNCPQELLVAPLWNRDKEFTIRYIRSRMIERGCVQGCLYRSNSDQYVNISCQQ